MTNEIKGNSFAEKEKKDATEAEKKYGKAYCRNTAHRLFYADNCQHRNGGRH
jgi:hypothetical protein